MSDFNLVDPKGWEYDLQSVYSAYMGYFQLHNVPWYERSWGVFFESFEEFLAFSWPVITVTDCATGRAHIVTRMTSIGAFLKMIKTRQVFGETLPLVENILRVTPFEVTQRHRRTVSDYALYKKMHGTLPAAVLASQRQRVREGEPKAVQELWQSHDKTFLAIDFEWSERNTSSCLEWGYAAVRCSHLEAVHVWPPDPEVNYRRGHYIVSDYVDKVHNKHRPNFPWAYAFGESQLVGRAKLPQVIQAIISSMVSPDSETVPNSLVLVGHGIHGDVRKLEEMKIKIPHNVLIVDTSLYERQLFTAGHRGPMQDPAGKPRAQGSSLSLSNLLQSLGVDVQCTPHNAGNDAFVALLALQTLIDPANTKPPAMRGRAIQQNMMRNASRSPAAAHGLPLPLPLPLSPGVPLSPPVMAMYGLQVPSPMMYPHPPQSPSLTPDTQEGGRWPSGYVAHQPGGQRPRKTSGLAPADGRGTLSRRGSAGIDEAAEKLGNMHV
ncbi:hypothetical protein PHLGIDRAFT_36980 [Phlebiopsis gigantea 11061_1 CR5-6]|uniref:Gfd2/YDR514C-like C-terminal domain-containing protein n=1 Tax=Phlebiopsis gigantea (strain 11061_1 CR5-6) TaxID=745531 RepID=A0A0C3RU01_PHLG1|nr:hypothetical protein PHLGIDRAFT_36980 [Phlebiopsis gigantea 11061_1 CR5-6]